MGGTVDQGGVKFRAGCPGGGRRSVAVCPELSADGRDQLGVGSAVDGGEALTNGDDEFACACAFVTRLHGVKRLRGLLAWLSTRL